MSNEEIAACFYDPFENDEGTMQDHLTSITRLMKSKTVELENLYGSIDQRTIMLQSLAVDMGELNKELASKTKIRDDVAAAIARHQKADEIHIEIDVLQSSPQGAKQLQQRYFKLMQ